MTLSNIKVGNIYKNYKEICNILEEEPKGGDSKKAQMKEWNRYFNWDRKGYKFIITEIYNEPKPKEDGRINNGQNPNSHHNQNGMYGKYIDKLLYTSLIAESSKTFVLTNNQIATQIGMVNKKFHNIRNDLESYLKVKQSNGCSNLTFVSLKDVIDITNSTINGAINSSLDRMAKELAIFYYKGTIVAEGKICRQPTKKEEELLEKLEAETMKELQIKNKTVLRVNYNLMRIYFQTLNAKINDYYGGLKAFFVGYILEVNDTQCKKFMFENNDEVKQYKTELNKTMIEETYKKAMKRKEKIVKEKGGFMGQPKQSWGEWIIDRLDENYEDNIKEVIQEIFPIDNSKIVW